MPIDGISTYANSVGSTSRASETDSNQNTSKKNSNELTLDDFYVLMAAQLQNQTMDSAVDNSEMLNQMAQMAMIQAINTFSTISMTSYTTSMIGKKVTMAVTDPESGRVVGEIVGTVTSVNLYGENPELYLDNEETPYPVAHIMQVHDPSYVPPEKDPPEGDGDDDKIPGEGGEDVPKGEEGTGKTA